MSVTVIISDGPLGPLASDTHQHGAGAVLCFEGVVREVEGQGRIAALDYQTYEPMAQRMLSAIAQDLIARHRLIAVHVEHSRGRVPVAQRSFRLVIAAPHRKEALLATDEFIDRLKRDVPIWKHAIWREGFEPPEPTAAA
jgi:molybdopterin synthase catalytic subunit